jgi:hypothetical protein
MLHRRYAFAAFPLLCAFLFLLAMTANGQTMAPPDARLGLRAALVLTPELCASKMKDKHKQTYEIGKAACAELEPALKNAFSTLTVVPSESQSGDAQVVLLPRFVAVDRTSGVQGFSKLTMVIQLEWTVKDMSGRTVWLETVQGTGVGHVGTMGTVGKNRKKTVADAMRDTAEQSASKMSSSPELRKLAARSAVPVPHP